MNRFLLCLFVSACHSPLVLAGEVDPTFHAIFRPPRLLGVMPTDLSVSPDGAFALYRWTAEDAEKPRRDLWIAATDGSSRRVLFAADEETGKTPRVWWTPRRSELLVLRAGWIELHDPRGEAPVRPLFKTTGSVHGVEFPDERRLVFSSGDERALWVVDLESGERRAPAAGLLDRSSWFQIVEEARRIALFARTTADEADGAEDGTTGRDGDGEAKPARRLFLVPLDANGPAVSTHDVLEGDTITVSPDARWAVRRVIDRNPGREIVVADYLTETVSTKPARSTLAGDRVGSVGLTVYDLESGESFAPAIDDESRFYLRGTHWSPDGGRLLIRRMSDDMKVRELLVLDPAKRRVRPVHVERDEAWIGGPFLWARWHPGKSRILFTSERSGFNHIYGVDVDGGQPHALTAGAFEVQHVRLIESTGHALLQTNEKDPAEKGLALLDLETRSRRALPTVEGCVFDVALAESGAAVVYRQERLGDPGDIHALRLEPDGEDGAPVRLTDFSRDALEALDLEPPEIVEYENPDDHRRVRALLYRPVPFDPAKRYPAVVFVHGAGYLQNVTKSMTFYGVNMLFHHRLARKGFFVLDPDYRHSAGYGREFRTDVHGWMGGKDLDDVVAGAAYLVGLGAVDERRIGIYGGSYGGFMTLMALFTKPNVFECGAALRSVTDWRSYSSWYTNPRLGTPKDDPENYSRSSPIDHAEKLTKPLLLLHGLVDTNVFAQDTIRLVEKLIQNEKDFELMLYPSQNHGFDDPESWIDEYRRIERFMERHLGGPALAPQPAGDGR